jgi:hypothetical protein
MVRTGRFTYCVYESGARREMLFDLVDDPGQMKNLAGRSEYAGHLERHRELLAGWVDRVGDEIGRAYTIDAPSPVAPAI